MNLIWIYLYKKHAKFIWTSKVGGEREERGKKEREDLESFLNCDLLPETLRNQSATADMTLSHNTVDLLYISMGPGRKMFLSFRQVAWNYWSMWATVSLVNVQLKFIEKLFFPIRRKSHSC